VNASGARNDGVVVKPVENSTRRLPRAVKKGLEVQEIAGELLIYDLERHRAYRLNPTTSLTWKHCDGKTSHAQMVSLLQRKLDIDADQELVRLVVARLRDLHLVESRSNAKRYSRRELIVKLKKLGLAASVMLPLVTSIVSPNPAEALSCTDENSCAGMPNCTPCKPPGCQHRCCNGQCMPHGLAQQVCGCP
jgi:hypothetical protein